MSQIFFDAGTWSNTQSRYKFLVMHLVRCDECVCHLLLQDFKQLESYTKTLDETSMLFYSEKKHNDTWQ